MVSSIAAVERARAAEASARSTAAAAAGVSDPEVRRWLWTFERERIHLHLIEDARKGLEDIKAGRVHDADKAIATRQQRRKAKSATAARSAEQRD